MFGKKKDLIEISQAML